MSELDWWLRLERYLAGDVTADERAAIEAWLAATPDAAAWVREFRRAVPVTEPASWDVDQAWSGVVPNTPVVSPRRYRWLGSVVALAAVVVLGFGVWVSPLRFGGVLHGATSTYATSSGQRLTVTLVDGTQVVLGPESHLTLDTHYGVLAREVQLNGEAYFTVVHDKQHPFAVRTNNLRVTDIGTEFDVRAYDSDERVAVVKGEVSALRAPLPRPLPFALGAGRGEFINDVREGGSEKRAPSAPVSATRPYDGNDTAYLSAGDVGEATDTGFAVVHHGDIAAATAWVQGGMAFEDVPLRNVVQDIGRTFGVTITIADTALNSKLVTAKFTGEPLHVVLDAVTQVVGAQYEQHGRAIVIHQGVVRSPGNGTPVRPLAVVRAQ